MKKIFFLVFYIIYFFTYSNLMASEEAKFSVLKSNKIYEIRKYSDRIVVEVISKKRNIELTIMKNYFLL